MSSNRTNLYELLAHLEERKAMFLGNKYTFQSLQSFIKGFELGCDRSQLETEKFNNFADFSIWLLGYLPRHFGKGGGWHWQISNRNLNDDENAFKEFFEFLAIFKTANKKTEEIEIKNSEVVDSIHKITMGHSKTIWIEGFKDNNLTNENWCLTEKELDEIISCLKETL